jgi:tRNA G37 N-methylase TrmD
MAVYDTVDSDVTSILDFILSGCDTAVSKVVTSISREPSG